MNAFGDFISRTYPLIFIVPIIIGKIEFLVYLIIFDFTVSLIKKGFKSNVRPKGAKQCDILCTSPNDEGKPGFPSGHVATTTCFIFILYHYYPQNRLLIGGLAYIVSMAYSRMNKKCHTLEQVIAGFIYGCIGAFAYIKLFLKNI